MPGKNKFLPFARVPSLPVVVCARATKLFLGSSTGPAQSQVQQWLYYSYYILKLFYIKDISIIAISIIAFILATYINASILAYIKASTIASIGHPLKSIDIHVYPCRVSMNGYLCKDTHARIFMHITHGYPCMDIHAGQVKSTKVN